MKETQFAVAAIISLFIACVAAQSSREGEWKSLGNPYNRDLFFKFLKSYITGRGTHMVNPGPKDKLVNDPRTNADSKYSNLQQLLDNNEIADIL
ncbi:uncharacterized protein C2orf66 homolog [Spea bombifrons]|uniref:uncharacterized protein C2orf66 homolog n=1 Tax=Spea bombifrons TaxID=233779 RepID=UPI00234B7D34|nr:uncharacterized protein C2orf66 homolog [Spea bombifrons]